MRTPSLPDVGAFIKEQRERSALSIRKLAELTGVSNPYLSQIERGLRRPSADILRSIADALSIRTETLYEKAGLLDERDGPDVITAIESDNQLTTKQKQALREIYASFTDQEES
ncbi:MAG: helix-turn-helix transcriptional regulator [Acidimicrobiia bacterium]